MTVMNDFSQQLSLAGDRLARREAVVRRRRRTTGVVAAGVLALGGVTAAATTIWNPQLGDDRRGHAVATADAPPPGQLERFGVLRRDQTDADRGAQATDALTFHDPGFDGIRTPWIRLLGVHDGDLGYLLIPVASAHGKHDVLCLYAQDREGGGESCWTTAEIVAGRALLAMVPAPAAPQISKDGTPVLPDAARPRGPMTFLGLVPDGVERVRLGEVTTTVHDNFFRLTTRDQVTPRNVEWLDGDGGRVGPEEAAP
jgi:hypothetical protein